jgi:hypothetical protein
MLFFGYPPKKCVPKTHILHGKLIPCTATPRLELALQQKGGTLVPHGDSCNAPKWEAAGEADPSY